MANANPTSGSNTRRILVIGAAGSMTSQCLEALAPTVPADCRFDLRDIDLEGAERACMLLGNERAEAGRIDLFDHDALTAAMAGAAFVILGAGPFHRTAAPVRRAAIAARVPYLDIDDDVESTLDAFALSDAAADVGVPLFIGCGASPGLTNVLAADLIKRLDSVEAIDVAWCVGDEGPALLGRSVLAHTLHMGAGLYQGWRGGARQERRSFAACRRWPLPGLERQSFYECAHPEAVMFGHSLPGLIDATCWGTIHPGPLNGLIKGIAEAERDGRIDYEAAIDFLRDVIAGRPTDKHAEKLALEGVKAQLARHEISHWEYYSFIAHALFKRQYPTRAATAALVRGVRGGRKVELLRYIDSSPAGSPLKIMSNSTGCAEAAFVLEAMSERGRGLKGTQCPEHWIDPDAFYRRFDTTMPPGAGDWLGPVLARPAGDDAAAWQPLTARQPVPA